ncbi:MAG: ABC transporter permease subunit, partial [Chloroflexota bacterium]|nr:ABC transporter permease subunit [Chloroflexota bacterium]
MERVADLVEQARRAASSGRVAEARRLVEEALVNDARNVDAWVLRAQLAGDVWEARRSWQGVLALKPNHEEALAFLHPSREAPFEEPVESSRTKRNLKFRLPLPNVGFFVALGQRLGFGAIVLLALMVLSFLGLEMARGTDFGPALTHALGESVTYVGRIARGDLGAVTAANDSILPRPISDVVAETVTRSFGLLGAALVIAMAGGITLGTLAALRRHSSWSLLFILVSIVGVSVPSFFAAILFQWLVIHLGRFSGGVAPLPVGGFGWDSHIILPALVLAARPLAQITRVAFISLSETLEQDFVRTAHSKGLLPRTILQRHVIRNAAVPILTTIGLSLRFSLSSLPVVELFFAWPGVGYTLLEAIARRDDKLTVVLVLCLGLLFIVVNTLLDLSYRLIDPRLKEVAQEQVKKGSDLLGALRSLLADVGASLVDNPITQWLQRRPSEPSPFRGVLAQQSWAVPEQSMTHRGERWRAWIRGTVRNLPFVLGGFLVMALFIIYLFGPALSPHSPYARQLVGMVDGQIAAPPFKPGGDYPWGSDFLGRDIMSLVLAGAQQTLLLAGMVVVGRMVLGTVLGALAGWQKGSRLDRAILSIAEMIAAFPTLLLAMILILAIGIRQGIQPFVIALTFVGWGEVMQYVRSEVLAIKPKPFIESAMAIGLRSPRIVVGHVLPNLLPALISIAALEMGAVLMLLGELGFIGIFIGGGVFTESGFHYSDVPEWGALLSNIRNFTRAYPWMALYPATAFFLAILAFNLFGEGVRRLVDDVGVSLTRLANRYTFALAVVVLLSWGWIRENTGEAAVYRLQAGQFDGERALAHVAALTAPEMEGRALGTTGQDTAAEYVAEQFAELELQRAGDDFSYFQNKNRAFEVLDAIPKMKIEDGGPPLRYHEDYVEYSGFFRNLGEASGPVQVLLVGPLADVQW